MNHPTQATRPDNLRQQTGRHIEQGAVTPDHSADQPQVLLRLNAALATTMPTTRRPLESILAVEEEHADKLADLLDGLQPAPAPTQTKDTP